MSYHHFASANLVRKTLEIASVKNYRFHAAQDGFYAELFEVRCALDTILIEEYKRLTDNVLEFDHGLLIFVEFKVSHSTDWCKKSLLCNETINKPEEMLGKAILDCPVHEQTRKAGPIFVKRDLLAKDLPSLRRCMSMLVTTEIQGEQDNLPPIGQRFNPRAVLVTEIVKKPLAMALHPRSLTVLEQFEAIIAEQRRKKTAMAIHYDANQELMDRMDTLYPMHLLKKPHEYVCDNAYVKIPLLYQMDFNMKLP